jgi:precorrin-2/cobalt-factor-2 C20-methyltransferase
MAGKFYGIGVGPGDPGLLTIKAYQTLEKVDVICVPKSGGDRDSLALSVVNQNLTRPFRRLELSFPMSRDKELLERSWSEAAVAVAREILQGHKVAFVTIGDPMLYSTYSYLLRFLRDRHPDLETATIPGITAMSACSSYIQAPLAEGEETLAVIPAAYGTEQLKSILDTFDNVVLMKVNRRLPEVIELLEEAGESRQAFFVSRCGYPDQYFTTNLRELLDRQLDYMSLLIIKRKGV